MTITSSQTGAFTSAPFLLRRRSRFVQWMFTIKRNWCSRSTGTRIVGYVLSNVAPQHYALIPKEADQPRPRAFKYFDFFASLTPESSGGWRRVDRLKHGRRGDVMAWRFPTIEPDINTGHVMILAETPALDASGAFYVVRVYDLAAEAHFDDTREPDGQPSPKGATGVDSGFINLKVDGEGRPIAYLFAPPADAEYSYRPIAIGRVEPF